MSMSFMSTMVPCSSNEDEDEVISSSYSSSSSSSSSLEALLLLPPVVFMLSYTNRSSMALCLGKCWHMCLCMFVGESEVRLLNSNRAHVDMYVFM